MTTPTISGTTDAMSKKSRPWTRRQRRTIRRRTVVAQMVAFKMRAINAVREGMRGAERRLFEIWAKALEDDLVASITDPIARELEEQQPLPR